jgi:alkanesulfonate monooxygenase SsuD/methylene tetrahydromethanopterin reductase-like flavin-dependent oxidoreductase (luciferase family)
VLVAPQYPSPLALANSLASLDALSGGRLTLGAGSGWSRAEFEALGAPFDHRGARLEEVVALCREVWSDDPSRHDGVRYPSFSGMRVLPKPAHHIPIWLGGRSAAALERATRIADGFAGVGLDPTESGVVAQRLRAERPEETFTVSMRVPIGQPTTAVELQALVGEYAAAGVQHLLFAPDRDRCLDPRHGGCRGRRAVGRAPNADNAVRGPLPARTPSAHERVPLTSSVISACVITSTLM